MTKELVCCNTLDDIYLGNSTKSDARNNVALRQDADQIPLMMGFLDVTNICWKHCPMEGKDRSKVMVRTQVMSLKSLRITTYSSHMVLLDSWVP